MTKGSDGDRGAQTVKAALALREAILDGALEPGERVSELTMVERIGVSRTPLRAALMRLAAEGLLEALPSGGYAVRAFSEADVFDAIEIRGALEGLAARRAAERASRAEDLADLRRCLDAIDALLAKGILGEEAFSGYVTLNARFHEGLTALAESPVLAREIERAAAAPFASPSSFVMAQSRLPEAATILVVAQDQHRCVLDAIAAREGARAESLMREHARLARRNLQLALRDRDVMTLVPGGGLIRRAG